VALAVTWLAWFAALHDLLCAVGGTPVDLAPPSYIVWAVALSSVLIGGLSAAVILSGRPWPLVIAIVCSLALVPWLLIQLSTWPALEYVIWYVVTLGAAALAAWQSVSSLRPSTKAR
jgi:hypothetical protein